MAITYSAPAGTHITSFVVAESSIATQTGGTDEVQVASSSVLPSTASGTPGYGSNIGDGSNGLGDTYIGRICVLRKGTGTEEIRIVTAEAFASSVTTLTVNEDWVSAPVATDAFEVCYEPGDIEDGGSGGGINLNSKSGLYELSNDLTIDSGGGLQIANGNALELDDAGASPSFFISSGGYWFAGLNSFGADISGGIVPSYNNATGEPNIQIQSGGNARIYDTLLWAQLVAQQFECANGSDARFFRVKWLNNTDELHLYDATIIDCSASGKETTTDIVRVDAGTTSDVFVLANLEVLDSAADTATETIELAGVLFSNVPGYVDVRQNKTWNMIDPVWDVTTFSQLTWTGTSTGNALNDRRSIKATVAQADGTLLENAVVNVYENTQLADLVLELVTNASGFAEDSFIYKNHVTNSATTTYGGHALQAGKWLYLPFVSTQVSTSNFNGTIVLSTDGNIVETTQATAISAGSGITWNEDANPSEIFDFTGGSGTLLAGMILTFSPSGAVGTITESIDGDSTAGTVHLETRDATAIANSDTFSRTGGTAGTFSGTYTNDSKQQFSIHIDCNALSKQAVYDYYAALTTETTLTAAGEIVWEWCRDGQGQAVFATGSSFFTETSNSKGIILVNAGVGTIDYYTDDVDVQWIPPVQYSFTLTGLVTNSEIRIYDTSDDSELGGVENSGTSFSYNYTYAGDVTVYVVIHNVNSVYIRLVDIVLSNADQSIPIQQRTDRNYI